MLLAVAYRPTQIGNIGFGPPAIQLRKIDTAVDQHLHAAGSTCLPRPSWRVDPDIDALHQMLGQVHVVVTEKDDMGAGLGPPNEVRPLLNQDLSRPVCRMRLAARISCTGR